MIGGDIDIASGLLKKGKLVGIPTETVYGLAANALNDEAVSFIFKAKQRPTFNPLIIHLAHKNLISIYATGLNDKLSKLANAFMPGPLSLLLPKKNNIPDIVTAGSERVAIRVPDHAFTSALLSRLDFPLAAPSANPFGYISPTTAQHVMDQLGSQVQYILDGGPCKVGIESTIVGEENGKIIVYRKGGLAIEKITSLIGKVEVRDHSSSNPEAPGMLSSHYAPRKKLIISDIQAILTQYNPKSIARLSFQSDPSLPKSLNQFPLSEKCDYAEAARNLFYFMREIDQTPSIEIIVADLLPEVDLGVAINDRLRRAAG